MNLRSLRVQIIKKAFIQNNKQCTILNGINFSFQKGKSYALTGASGTGKSTLLQIIGGLEQPTSGAVFFNDDNIADISRTKKAYYSNHCLGFVFQNPYLIAELTALENIMVKGLIAGKLKQNVKDEALAILQHMQLDQKADSFPSELSGGQQQRIALARALIAQPDFLCADEPTGNLDKETGRGIVELLKEYQKKWGMGLIISTHDKNVFEQMDTVLVLQNGTLYSEKKNITIYFDAKGTMCLQKTQL